METPLRHKRKGVFNSGLLLMVIHTFGSFDRVVNGRTGDQVTPHASLDRRRRRRQKTNRSVFKRLVDVDSI